MKSWKFYIWDLYFKKGVLRSGTSLLQWKVLEESFVVIMLTINRFRQVNLSSSIMTWDGSRDGHANVLSLLSRPAKQCSPKDHGSTTSLWTLLVTAILDDLVGLVVIFTVVGSDEEFLCLRPFRVFKMCALTNSKFDINYGPRCLRIAGCKEIEQQHQHISCDLCILVFNKTYTFILSF